jgi:hypothetical protein
MKKSNQIIGFINSTIKGFSLIVEPCTEERAQKIIMSIVSAMSYNDPVTKEVVSYCKQHYNFKTH